MRLPFRVFWFLLAVFAIVDGIGALRYLLPHVPAAAPLDNFIRHRVALSLHAFCGGIALLAGPLQFLPAFRTYHWRTHRVLGRIYFAGVLIGGIASLNLARHAQTGLVASSGFLALGALWLATTVAAVSFILRGKQDAHRRWMIRSYALTAAAITLRIYLPLSVAMHVRFEEAYPLIAWICWIPNLLIVELYLWFVPGAGWPSSVADFTQHSSVKSA
jgi:uncharacterized membrane protein